mmetsp:Transcript_102/g.169  ORF Transcript_102/g.169 Transcript_102/m.169 type:complete len:224 (-) Transcript_102:139-810(-)|eukprot:CAMPEP_0167761766 /NCGR_PEP_ID=MMETSP0110_2-20121227/12363_1 /TAXON_ID=629695 /ORGANISM="Gymnochlora sp., Strain CCMP2014" /LENGTH=223 /DNA_ID=CAMNT_0007648503 /DNA_START=78 /DNA_END=749 /DNA_ORIENTATION=-
MDKTPEKTKPTEDKTEDDAAKAFEASLKLKKRKKKKKTTRRGEAKQASEGIAKEKAAEAGGDYAYVDLLERCYKLLQDRNPNLSVKKRYSIPQPMVRRIGSKRTGWANFPQICKVLNRNVDHVQSYVLTELGADASNDGSGGLVIKGRYIQKQIESLLKKYIVEYVTCRMCRSPDTTLSRDPLTRLYFLQCQTCGSNRSVAPIKSGFRATMRGERRKAKMQAR